MKLNLFVAWSAFALALIGVITIAFTLVAAGSGHSGFALASGVAAAVAVMLAVGMVAGTSGAITIVISRRRTCSDGQDSASRFFSASMSKFASGQSRSRRSKRR